MPPVAPLSTSEAARSPPVDLEMLSEWLIFQGVQLASEFKGYAVESALGLLGRYHHVEGALLDVGSRLCHWLQHKHRREQAPTKEQLLLPLPQPAMFPLTLQHMDYITERFDDVKTQLQLVYAAVDNLRKKENQSDAKLDRLQEHLRRIPSCRCERSTPSSQSFEALAKKKLCRHNKTALKKRPVEYRSETLGLQVDRLEVPLTRARPPTTLREESSAILYWIIKAVDGGAAKLHNDESKHLELQAPQIKETSLVAAVPNTTQELSAREQTLTKQVQAELRDSTNTDQQTAMHIAQLYNILARDQ